MTKLHPTEVRVIRSSAALYLAWQYGIGRARRQLAGQELALVRPDPTTPVFVYVSSPFSRRATKAAAREFACAVKQVVAFQEGRLRRPLSSGHVYAD